MKKLNYMWGALAAAAMSLAACSPDEFEGVNENGLPLAEDAVVRVDVDQTTNQATFNLEGNGVYPIWIMSWESTNPYSTQNGLKKVFAQAGDYTLNYRVGNRNGFSQGIGEKVFHIDNMLVDFDALYTVICDKAWRLDKDKAGHIGYGETGTDGLGQYSAAPNEKAGMGAYDDEITFTRDGKYTYNPGADGLTLLNTACTVLPGNNGDGNDFSAATQAQTADFTIASEGNDLYLTLPANTLFPYIATDGQYANPKFRIESYTGSSLVLIYDDGKTAWHYILTSKTDEPGFGGFDPDSDCNMFKTCQFTNEFYYATGESWSQLPNPEMTVGDNEYTVSLPTATQQQWQAQVKFVTDMTTNSATNYDFSCKLMSTKAIGNATVKLVKHGDDNTFYFAENVALEAYEEYVFYMSDMPGIDMDNVDVVFDFGGNPENTEVTISDIVLEEHGCDGIEAPAEEDKTVYDYDAPSNLWKSDVDDAADCDVEFYYAPGWVQIADPGFSKDGGTYTITLPQATNEQWQAQVKIKTGIPAEAETPYDFCCTLMADKAMTGATVKLTDSTDDNNFFFAERVDLPAYEEVEFKMPAKVISTGAAGALTLVLDFGGCQENTTVTISNIVLQKTAQ